MMTALYRARNERTVNQPFECRPTSPCWTLVHLQEEPNLTGRKERKADGVGDFLCHQYTCCNFNVFELRVIKQAA